MDFIICEALNEICCRSSAGIQLRDLWARIQVPISSSGLHLCEGVKQAVWAGLLRVPAVQVVAPGEPLNSGDASIQSVAEAERLGVKLVAASHLVDSSLGLYDIKYSGCEISSQQRSTLERLAAARTSGITQSQLAKELDVKGNNFFYVVRSLECQGLLVRQSSVLRTRDLEAEGNGMKIISTNLMHLHRYGKHLNMSSQKKIEITQIDSPLNMSNGDESVLVQGDTVGEFGKSDVQVRDYTSDMRAICDKLEESNGKVLVVSDIKTALGYGGRSKGHKAWRDILKRLKEAGIVEEFQGEVNKKVLPCLRLRKKFDLTCTNEGPESLQPIKCGKRGQISDQLVELSLDSQVHDLVKAEGPKGLLFTEVCERLGIHSKRNHTRLSHIFSKFGMHQEPESHNRSIIYRMWTLENYPGSGKQNLDRKQLPGLMSGNPVSHMHSSSGDLFQNGSGCLDDLKARKTQLVLKEACNECPGNGHDKQLLVCGTDPVNVDNEDARVEEDVKLSVVSDIAESDGASAATLLSSFSSSGKDQIHQRYPCLKMTATSMQRDQRILERLQNEKFILNVELYKWLAGFEKDKQTTMDRRTLDSHLSKLQKEGLCKCIVVSAPIVSHCWRKHPIYVVLHPSVESLSPELLGQVHERMRKFEMQSRGHGLRKSKNNQCAPVLAGVDRTSTRTSSEVQSVIEAMKSYGFIPAKMVRARLLHNFFWSHLSALPNGVSPLPSDGDLISSHGSYKLFALDDAIRAMPLQLFLHVAGSAKKDDTLFEKCRLGLCLSDLGVHNYKYLVDAEAIRRLSLVIDILRRLKLIRLVTEESTGVTDMVLTYAMELNPYIEEPLSRPQQTSDLTFNFQPKVRHDFVLLKQQTVDAYWKILEYCYAANDPVAASHAFPGSAVKEVYHYRTWTANRVMTAEQHAELLKHVPSGAPSKKIPFTYCDKIARKLNLSLEQVLHFCCNKTRSHYSGFMGSMECRKESNQATRSNARKRKASTDERPPKSVKLDAVTREMDEPNMPVTSASEVRNAHDCCHTPANLACDMNCKVDVDEGNCSFIDHVTSSKPRVQRKRKFLWTDGLDRKLVMQYARFRASLGARFHRVEWVSVPDLPAPPETCRRRMALLKSNPSVRKAVMKLLNVLGDRYVEHTKNQDLQSYESFPTIQDSPSKLNNQGPHWDDFEDASVQKALDEVLYCKQMAKDAQEERITCSSARDDKSGRCHGQSEEVLDLLNNQGSSVERKTFKSLSVATAVELLKVVFLNNSTASAVPELLRMTLRQYSEEDILAAFKYLREKIFLVNGQGSQPYILSKKFLQNTFSSPFPTNTGRRAANFAGWLSKRDKDLLEDRINLDEDLQCGEIFHLFALVSSGELLISPYLPDEGVGEAEEIRGIKRKTDNIDLPSTEKVKKQKSQSDGEFARREKGFPGIIVSVNRVFVSRTETLQQSVSDKIDSSNHCIDLDPVFTPPLSDHVNYGDNVAGSVLTGAFPDNSLWTDIANYSMLMSPTLDKSKQGVLLRPELFETAYGAIREAGQQGLKMNEISEIALMNGNKAAEFVVDALEVFGLIIKVNAYDCVHIVDVSWRPKYRLNSVASHHQYVKPHSLMKPTGRIDESCWKSAQRYRKKFKTYPQDTDMSLCDEHKISIIDKDKSGQHCIEVTSNDGHNIREDYKDGFSAFDEGRSKSCSIPDDSYAFQPILPWLNGDGSINNTVYKGLVRRILGTVMQNPGILEEHLIIRMDVLNPQNCRKLLELMVLDNHVTVREIQQTIFSGPPAMLGCLFGRSSLEKTQVECQKHFFANPMSTFLL